MYLKSIEIHGFKSFANKTLFEFHNGITCIVGPNGSGKSNVADAVRWVLGEQSAKQLRGSNMQDVIFSGTQARKPQGFASVAITFDNADRKLALDYNEVTVARRVYRSGESEYLLNGTQCRLRDIMELFYDTGIGKEGYSIIGQGQIDRILSTKPEDRRELFDEAAGIVKFKRRKSAAQKRLDSEQANMVRLSDIMSELEKQVGPLERQSRTAREYLRLRDQLMKHDINAFVLETQRLEGTLKELEENLAISTKDFEETNSASEALKSRYESEQEQLDQFNEQIGKTRDAISEAAANKQELEGQIKVLNEQINTEKLRHEHAAGRLSDIEAQNKEDEERLKELDIKRQECSASMYDAKNAEDRARDELATVEDNIAAFKDELKQEQDKMIGLLNEKTSFVGELQKYETLLEQAKTEKAEYARRIIDSKTDESSWIEKVKECKEQYESASEAHRELAEKNKIAQEQLESKSKRLEQSSDEYNEKRRLHQVTVTRADSLRNLAERYEGYGSSIRKIMEVRNRFSGIEGVVADIIHVERRYETAIETALGGAIQNIVTETEQTAKQLIGYLKQNKLGRATFLPLDAITVRDEFRQRDALKEKGIIGLASSLVQVDDKYKRLADFLLGRIIVADTIDNGMKVSAKYKRSLRIVTLDGELLNPGGAMTGGAFRNASNLLGRNRELEELEGRIKKEESELKTLKSDIDITEAEVEELEAKIQQLRNSIQDITLTETEARISLRQAEAKVEDIRNSRADLDTELALMDDKIRRIKENHQAVQSSIEELESRGSESLTSADKTQESANEANDRRDSLIEEISAAQLKITALEEQQKFLTESVLAIKEASRRRSEEAAELTETKGEISEAVNEKQAQIAEASEQIQKLAKDLTEMETSLGALEEKRGTANDALKSFFEKREELSTRLSALDRDIFRMNDQKEKQEGRLDELTDYIWNEYELKPSDARAAYEDEGIRLSEIKQLIAELKRSIKALGNVNVNAIDEYKEVSERYTFMKTQYDDLVESEKSLIKVIDELDDGMRKQFEEKFAQIKVEFDKVFKELFGGGKGTLELVEDEDIIEAGIRIISQPPGKKLQNMMQLSGGEKALTAIALLFAIQNLKPSPFCLLDEIEAALDDSNVGRFAAYLHKLTENTQFIVITHRRGTMTSADRLYGITMQEKGVSTLVSVNLIEEQLDK